MLPSAGVFITVRREKTMISMLHINISSSVVEGYSLLLTQGLTFDLSLLRNEEAGN